MCTLLGSVCKYFSSATIWFAYYLFSYYMVSVLFKKNKTICFNVLVKMSALVKTSAKEHLKLRMCTFRRSSIFIASYDSASHLSK